MLILLNLHYLQQPSTLSSFPSSFMIIRSFSMPFLSLLSSTITMHASFLPQQLSSVLHHSPPFFTKLCFAGCSSKRQSVLTLPIMDDKSTSLLLKGHKVILFFVEDCLFQEFGGIKCIMLGVRFLSENVFYGISIIKLVIHKSPKVRG